MARNGRYYIVTVIMARNNDTLAVIIVYLEKDCRVGQMGKDCTIVP